jgi:hypothetical protein
MSVIECLIEDNDAKIALDRLSLTQMHRTSSNGRDTTAESIARLEYGIGELEAANEILKAKRYNA